jgi:hypothetical protein
MAYWEFLLQQDGDLTWLPLETGHVEILEGRYRIVAHTSHCDTPVEIHLTQRLAAQMPSKRRFLKRQGQTNDEGLMVVMPFTHLTAGTWTIRCVAAAIAAADPLAYGVQLRVVPVENDPENWTPDWHIPEEEPLPEALQALHQPVPTALDIAASGTAPSARLSQPERLETIEDFPELEAESLGSLPLRLRLAQQAFMAQPQQPITLAGDVIATEEASALPGIGTLGVQLRDPAQGNVVARWSRSLTWTSLPTAFELAIPVPDIPDTRLLVGEMSLWQGTTQLPQVMAIQGFTVTTNLALLLETVTQKGDGLAFQEAVGGEGDKATTPDQTAGAGAADFDGTPPLAMPAVREVPFRRIYLPVSGLTLPPQIQSAGDRQPRPLDLPTLPNQSKRSAPAAQRSLELPLIAPKAPEASPDPSRSPERTLELPSLAQEPQDVQDDVLSGGNADLETQAEPISEVPSLVPDAEFTALNLKDRFWGRLSALAHEGQSAAADRKREMAAAGVEPESEAEPGGAAATNLNSPIEPALPTMAVAAPSHEVVIYEDSEPPIVDASPGATTSHPDSEPEAIETLVVPVPQVTLPDTALVAGGPLTLTVGLSAFPHRLAVKFWMTDIQNRSLIEKPRWLMNWSVSGEGQLEALLHLQVPMGCLEVRFEAIAVDLVTQEESHKITLQRSIIPSQGAIVPPEDLV